MFQEHAVVPESIPDTVKKVFDSYRTVLGITEKMLIVLRSPALLSMSRTEYLATVESWQTQLREVTQNTPLRAKL